jgi:hypothetical protein
VEEAVRIVDEIEDEVRRAQLETVPESKAL